MLKGKFSEVIINHNLPDDYKIQNGNLTTKTLKSSLVKLAKKDPMKYSEVAPKIKKIGDEFATYEGITVGLDDIEPEYSKRDAIISAADSQLRKLPKGSPKALDVLIKAQEGILDLTKQHPGDMALTAKSGSRGNMTQLMKSVATPVVVGDFKGNPIPFLIKRSYAEGLSPMEAWIAGDESRAQVIKGQLGTAEPGEMQKILSSVMSGAVISDEDCGTDNGIRLAANDPSLEGRFEAKSGHLIDSNKASSIASKGGYVLVRSPMTCELDKGVCKKCMGATIQGGMYSVGDNVGIRAAQAMSEPLTQLQLSAKHGVSLVKGDANKPRGLKAFKQFVEIPKAFFFKAPVATSSGKIDSVEKAPQGGFDIKISGNAHYIPPGRDLLIKKGDEVEAGDVLSSGIPSPDDIIQHKGLGAGREYLVKSIRNTYDESGVKIDQRNLELLAKTQLNYVKVIKPFGDLIEDDVVPLSEVTKNIRGTGTKAKVTASIGKILTRPMFEHPIGTVVTKRVAEDILDKGGNDVEVADTSPILKPVMTSASRTPLLNPNWMQRLGYRYQKDTLIDAASFGQKAELHGYDPMASIAYGKELKRGPKGEY